MDTMAPSPPKPRRPPPALLFALGHEQLPVQVTVAGVTWRWRRTFKHDFFAATGLYERDPASPGNAAGLPPLAVLKLQRTHGFCGLPLRWLGAFIARHESAIYQALWDVPGIPRFLGVVGPTGFLHEYIAGRDLREPPPLTPAYFDQFQRLLSDMHRRHVAYVDCNKRENILVGDDGRPWLIDFQISVRVRGDGLFARWMFRRFVRADWYHFYKHKAHLLRDACSPQDIARAKKRGVLHRLHRLVTRPLVLLRRKLLARYDLDDAHWN